MFYFHLKLKKTTDWDYALFNIYQAKKAMQI